MASRTIGATLKLSGEREFTSAVKTSSAALKTMQSEMKLVDAEFAGQQNSLEALTKKHSVLEETLAKTQKVQEDQVKALNHAQSEYDRIGKSLESYKTELTSAQSELEKLKKTHGEDSEQVAEQERVIKELAKTVEYGEGQYTKAAQSIENWKQQINTSELEVIKLNKQLSETDKYLDEAKNSTDGCAKSIDVFGKAVKDEAIDASEAVKDFSEDVATYFTTDKVIQYADKVSSAFQQVASSAIDAAKDVTSGYDTIARLTGATGSNLDKFKSIADDMYGDIPVDMELIAQSIGEVNTRFGQTDDELKDTATQFVKFAEVNNVSVIPSIDKVQNILSAFNVDASETSKFLDVMTASAQRTGAGIDQMETSLLNNASALQEMGADLYTATDFVAGLETAGIDAESVLSGLKRAYTSAAKDGKDFASVLADVQNELLTNEDTVAANNAAYELFGKSFASLSAAVRSGQINFTNLADSMSVVNNSTDTVSRTFAETEHTWDDMTVAMNNLKLVGSELTMELLQSWEPVVEDAVELLKDVATYIKDMPDGTKRIVSSIGAVVVALGVVGPKILSVVQAVSALKQAGNVKKQLTDLRDSIDNLKNVGKAVDTMHDVAESVDNVSDAVDAMSDTSKIVDSIDDVTDTVDNLSDTSSAATKAIGGMSNGLSSLASNAGGIAVGVGIATAAIMGMVSAMHAAEERAKDSAAIAGYIDATTSATDATNALVKSTTDSINSYKLSLETLDVQTEMANVIVKELEKLGEQSSLTSADISVQESYIKRLNDIYPDLNLNIDKSTGVMTANGKIVKDLSKYMDDYESKLRDVAREATATQIAAQYAEIEAQIRINNAQLETNQNKVNDLTSALTGLQYGAGGTVFDILAGGAKYLGSELKGVFTHTESAGTQISALNRESGELSDSNKKLENQLDAVNQAYFELTGSYYVATDAIEDLTEASDEQEKSIIRSTGITQSSAQKYIDLAKRIHEFNGDLSAVSQSFTEEETELQNLFNSTVTAWQTSHDTIKQGFSSEITSLDVVTSSWDDYKKSVLESLDSVQSKFTEITSDENVTWDAMTASLTKNTEAYDAWNTNVTDILSSVRYQNDEAFREIANSIMSGGINSADYLQQFVDNVDLSVSQANEDIAGFAALDGVEETYANLMANLQTATEDGMSGMASAFVETKDTAVESIEALGEAMDKQAQAYTEFTQNAQNIIESEEYRTNATFREYANTLLANGTASAQQISDLWDTMQSDMANGTSNVADALQSFTELKDAQDTYADYMASIQTSTQDGMDGVVTIVDDAGDAWKIAAENDSDLLAEGVDISKFTDKVSTGIQNAQDSVIETLSDENFHNSMADMGVNAATTWVTAFKNTIKDTFGVDFSQSGSPVKSNVTASLLQQQNASKLSVSGRAGSTINMTVNSNSANAEQVAGVVIDRIRNIFV